MLDEEDKEVDHPYVVENDLNDYISENDMDDDGDMNEPFTNIYFEPDSATDVEFDEEEDEWYIEVCVLYDDLYMFLFCII